MDCQSVLTFTDKILRHPLFSGWKVGRLVARPSGDVIVGSILLSNGRGLSVSFDVSTSLDGSLRLQRALMYAEGKLKFFTEVIR